MATESAFLRSIEADLADPARLLIYADWLEEHGQEQLAHAWRWMARRGYRPARRILPGGDIRWIWWHDRSHEMMAGCDWLPDLLAHPEARLPLPLFWAMGAAGSELDCQALAEAVERLARGLEILPQLAGLDRRPGNP